MLQPQREQTGRTGTEECKNNPPHPQPPALQKTLF
jgi:hypothetical protein